MSAKEIEDALIDRILRNEPVDHRGTVLDEKHRRDRSRRIQWNSYRTGQAHPAHVTTYR